MSTRTSDVFRMSLIATAVVSLSACSSLPRVEDYDLSRVGDGIVKAGRTTADVSSRVWNRTTYLLGFSDDDGQGNVSDEGLLMDAEDVVLLESSDESQTDTVVRPIVIRSAVPSDQPLSSGTPMTTTAESGIDETPINADVDSDLVATAEAAFETPTTTEATTDSRLSTAATDALIHEVAVNETLWDIAKATTGDATNWHLLADSNNLGPGASVYPGQKLIIPAHMVKTEDADEQSISDTQQTDAAPYVDTQNLAANTQTADDDGSQSFKVGPGETLWDFSKRVTGDATNWQIIAESNRFTDEQATLVRSGQTILVPDDLVRPELSAVDSPESISPPPSEQSATTLIDSEPTLSAATESTDSAVQAGVVQPTQTASAESPADDDLSIRVITSEGAASRQVSQQASKETALDRLADPSMLLDETQPIKIIEATYKARETTTALPVKSPDEQSAETLAEVMVSGTYYPKAVYNEADFSSSLLMRVSPGTTLQVSKTIGNWYQVRTDKGMGYVHQRDIR